MRWIGLSFPLVVLPFQTTHSTKIIVIVRSSIHLPNFRAEFKSGKSKLTRLLILAGTSTIGMLVLTLKVSVMFFTHVMESDTVVN